MKQLPGNFALGPQSHAAHGDANGPPNGVPHRSFHWRRYLLFLRKWWWIPALTALIGVGVQIFLICSEPEQFLSSARMWVSGKLQIPEGKLYQEEVQNFFGTQKELMQSGRVTERAHAFARASRPDRQPVPLEFTVGVLPRTSIVALQATGTDPEYLQRFLSGVMDEYLKVKRKFRTETTDEALAAVNQEYSQKQRELDAEEDRLDKFKKENDLVVLQAQGESAGSRLAQSSARLSDLHLELKILESISPEKNLDLQSQPEKTGAALTNMLANGDGSNGGSKNAQEFFNHVHQLQILKLQIEQLSVNLKPKHPKIIKLSEDIAQLEKLMKFYRQQSQDELAASRNRLMKQIEGYEARVKEWEGKALEANLRLAEFDRLRLKVQRLQTICDDLYKTVQKVDLDRGFSQETLSKLEDPMMGVPIPRPWIRKVIVGVVLGLLAGALLVYLVERGDDRVVPSTDFAYEFDLSIVGRVPEVKLLQNPDKDKALPRLRDRQLFAESYRNIRSSLLFMPVDERRPKTIIVTSAVPYEGKSTVTVNLAQTLAHAGCRVLLIDGDLRRGQLQKFFQLPSEPGLSDLLEGRGNAREAVLPTAQENLFFIPVGKPCVAPGELFLSSRTDSVLKELAGQYDFILIDTPPILAADDTTSLAPKTDGVLFVVRESFSKSGLVRPAIEQLLDRQARVLGLIVNRANSFSKEYCYYKYSEYYGSK